MILMGRFRPEADAELVDYEESSKIESDIDDHPNHGENFMISLVRRNGCHSSRGNEHYLNDQVSGAQAKKMIGTFH